MRTPPRSTPFTDEEAGPAREIPQSGRETDNRQALRWPHFQQRIGHRRHRQRPEQAPRHVQERKVLRAFAPRRFAVAWWMPPAGLSALRGNRKPRPRGARRGQHRGLGPRRPRQRAARPGLEAVGTPPGPRALRRDSRAARVDCIYRDTFGSLI